MRISRTRAINIDCPLGHAKAGCRCCADTLCRARINAAAKQTRDANVAARRSGE